MISFLLNNKYLIALAILGAIIAAQVLYSRSLQRDIESLKKDNTVLTVKLQTSNNSIATLQSAITEQNAAVEKLKADAEQRAKDNASLIAQARAEASTARKRAQDLLTRVVPQGKTVCDAANDLFNEEITNAK